MVIEDISLVPLLKAYKKFELFRPNITTEQERAGVIQAFEYCFELTWKLMKRILAARGMFANSPKEVFRLAAQEGFIEDLELWFEFLKMRNLTVHSYQEEEAMAVIAITGKFSLEIERFLQKIKAI